MEKKSVFSTTLQYGFHGVFLTLRLNTCGTFCDSDLRAVHGHILHIISRLWENKLLNRPHWDLKTLTGFWFSSLQFVCYDSSVAAVMLAEVLVQHCLHHSMLLFCASSTINTNSHLHHYRSILFPQCLIARTFAYLFQIRQSCLPSPHVCSLYGEREVRQSVPHAYSVYWPSPHDFTGNDIHNSIPLVKNCHQRNGV